MTPAARRPLSLQARSLFAAGIALAAFLGLTGFALDAAIFEALRSALRERLESYADGYLAASDVSRARRWLAPEVGPDRRFERPNSGLYAGVVGPVDIEGVRYEQWRSASAIGKELPFAAQLKPGQTQFVGPVTGAGGLLYVFSMGVTWEVQNRGSVDLTLHIGEDAANLQAQLDVFRGTLLVYLGGLGLLLLALLLVTLRWSLRPLRHVATDLARVERGEQDRLSESYPSELSGLTANLNEFIESERDHLTRYRNTLADLAHSLKTPLAVVRSQLESDVGGEQFRWTVLEQIGRMDQIVAYQLSRAATSGHATFVAPIRVEPHAEEIVSSLEKVYKDKNMLCEFEIAPRAVFYGEQGDLLELLGNMVENGFKFGKRAVLLTARALPAPGARRDGLELIVEDDGPGIGEDQLPHLLQRGVRGDERTKGHGIGLAIVQDIVRAYRGELSVARSPTLGGAAFRVCFKGG